MTRSPLGRRLFGLGLLAVTGCARTALPPLPEYRPQTYRLGPGDQIKVTTFGEQQLSGEYRVDDQGQIAMPLIGSIGAAGRGTKELEEQITDALSRGDYLKNPHVTVEIVAYRPIFVLGEVTKPGQYGYQPGMTLLTAVAIAGGFTYRAVQDEGNVIRTVNGVAIKGRAEQSTFLAPGDVVEIRERYF